MFENVFASVPGAEGTEAGKAWEPMRPECVVKLFLCGFEGAEGEKRRRGSQGREAGERSWEAWTA